MKRRALFLAAFAVLGMVLLTACTDSEGEIAQNVRNEAVGDAGTPVPGNADGAGTQEQAADGADSAAAEDAPGEPISETQAPAATEAPTESQTEPPQTEGTQTAPVTEDIWTGTYASEQETVTLTLTDEKSLSFAFANAGIASTAEIDGATAVYQGDDHHVVVFTMNEGVLNVSVQSEEDYDASGSPLNGIYVRKQ